jgi:K+-sensing histidine kinase KdpD
MDLSNREEAAKWYKVAAEEPDPDLRKEALATHRQFRKLALREERMRLRLQKPGYGVRSMIGWIVFVALIILISILALSKIFSIVEVCMVFGLAIGLSLIAAAVTLKVYGHISEDAMLAIIQKGLIKISASGVGKPVIEATTAIDQGRTSPLQRHSPSIRK